MSWVSLRAVTITTGTSLERRMRAAQLEAVDARQHDVDQHHVGGRAREQLDRLLTTLGFVDGPTLVLERELHRRPDAFVVLDGKDSCSHAHMMPENGSRTRS